MFVDPELGLCTVTGPSQPTFLQSFTSKEIFLKEHGLSGDHWEDEAYGDHEHDEDADDGSDEDN